MNQTSACRGWWLRYLTTGTAVVYLFFGTIGLANAQPATSCPSTYEPQQRVGGSLRMWGHGSRDRSFIGPLVQSWQDDFRKYQPEIVFDTSLKGDKSAIGGLYTGAADLAIMERDLSSIEKDSYEQLFGRRDPFGISVATGSLDRRDHAMALVIFVHADNPLTRLTLAQLDAIFGADHRRGLGNIRTWGELGLTGDWAHRPINGYGFTIAEDASQYFEKAVMEGSRKWAGNYTEFADVRLPDGKVIDAGQRIVDRLMQDRYGIAISNMAYRGPGVKPLALSAHDGDIYYEPTRDTVAQRKYSLSRTVSIYANREPGKALEPQVREYLHYLLSREGQAVIARDGGYFALTDDLCAAQLQKLQ